MTTELEIACTTKGTGWHDRMFICKSNLESLFEGDWFDKDFVACLKKATPKSRRPKRDALKLKVPFNFVGKGVIVEGPDGRFSDQMLVAESDGYIFKNALDPESASKSSNWWVWIEYDI